jgi:CPA1 family monovalent cation:H+ antiporter
VARRVGAPYPAFLALGGALLALEHEQSPVAAEVRQEFIAHLGSAGADMDDGEAGRSTHRAMHHRALDAARHAVLGMRTSDEIGDDAFHQMEEELDWIEMSAGGKDDA